MTDQSKDDVELKIPTMMDSHPPPLSSADPESLARFLLGSVVFNDNISQLQSFDRALDVCLKAVHIIRDKKQEYLSQKELKCSSKTSLTSLSNEPIFEICSFLNSKSKCHLRFTSCSVHKGMMRCPLDFFDTKHPAHSITQYFPLRLWRSLSGSAATSCCDDCDASHQLKMMDFNKCELHSRHVTNSYRSPSELNSLGFDRSWTITGLNITDANLEEFRSILESIVKDNGSGSLRKRLTLNCSLDDWGYGDSLLCQINNDNCGAVRGVDCLYVHVDIDYGSARYECLTNRLKYFTSLRSMNLDGVLLRPTFLSDVSCLLRLEELKCIRCDIAQEGIQNLDCLRPLSGTLKVIHLDISSQSPWINSSSLSSLVNLTHFQLSNDHGALELNLSSFSNLTHLEEIFLPAKSTSQASGNISSLIKLTKLKRLRLCGSNIQGDIAVLGNIHSLDLVSIVDCEIEGDISALCSLTQLSSLYLQSKPLSGDIVNFSKLKKLTDFSLYGLNNVHGDIASLSQLSRLQYVHIENCPKIVGDSSTLQIAVMRISNCPQILMSHDVDDHDHDHDVFLFDSSDGDEVDLDTLLNGI
jgi:hypothetical protein